MRDPNRINRICELLNTLWQHHPEQRLGQLLINVSDGIAENTFYHEDDKLEKELETAIRRANEGRNSG